MNVSSSVEIPVIGYGTCRRLEADGGCRRSPAKCSLPGTAKPRDNGDGSPPLTGVPGADIVHMHITTCRA